MTNNKVLLPPRILNKENVPRYVAYKNYVYDRATNELTRWDYTDRCFRVTASVADVLNKNEHLSSDHKLIRDAYTWVPYVEPVATDRGIINAGEITSELYNRIAMSDAGNTVVTSIAGAIMMFLSEMDAPVHEYAMTDNFGSEEELRESLQSLKYKQRTERTKEQRAVVTEYATQALEELKALETQVYNTYTKLLSHYLAIVAAIPAELSNEVQKDPRKELTRLDAMQTKLVTDHDIATFNLRGTIAMLLGRLLPVRDGASEISSSLVTKTLRRREILEATVSKLTEEIYRVSQKRHRMLFKFAGGTDPSTDDDSHEERC